MKAAGYIRVSSIDQIEGTSLDHQKDSIIAYAKMKGIELVAVYQDNGVSGGKPIAERPEGAKLVEAINSGKVSAVIVLKLDRAFRNVIDCLSSIDAWEKLGTALHIVDLGGSSIDTSSPSGRFMLTILSAAAEMERGMIRDRCNSGRKIKKAQGLRIGEVPFGYDLDPATGKLVDNSSEQKTIFLVKRLFAKGESMRGISKALNTKGLPTKKNGTWQAKQISSILNRSGIGIPA